MARSRELRVVVSGDASSLGRAFRKASTDATILEGNVKRVHARVRGALTGIGVAAAAGVGAAFGAAVKQTVEFDRAMRNVNSIARLSQGQLAGVQKQLLAMAGRTAQAPKTLADGLYDLVSSGFKANDSMKILEASAKAASAGLTTTEVSTKAVAAVLNAYHLRASDAAKVSDELFQTVNLGVVRFDELANNIGDVLPFAAQLHVGLDQVGAAITTMTKAGISAPETMTRLKNLLVAFIKPSQDMEAAIKATGAASAEALIRHKGMEGALEAVIKTTDGSKTAIAKLFPNIRGLGGALALSGINARGAAKDLKGFADTSGATNRVFAEQSKSVSLQWQRLRAQLSALGIQLGEKLLPIMTTVVSAVSKFIGQMQSGRGAGGQFASTMRDVGDAIGPIAQAIGGLVRAIAPLVKATLPGVKQALRGMIQSIKGFAEVISGIIHGDFGKAWRGIKDIVGGGLQQAIGRARVFIAPFKVIGGKLGGAIKDGITSATRGIVSAIASVMNGVIDVINAAIDAYNKIPLAPNIPKIPHVGGGGGGHAAPTPYTGPTHHAGQGGSDRPHGGGGGHSTTPRTRGATAHAAGGPAAHAASTLGFGELQSLWVQAGGDPSMATLMAHVAMAESGGNPAARNPSGASGLWQILGQPFAGNVFDPLTNARMAVWKYEHQGLGAWDASRGSWGQYVGQTSRGGAAPASRGGGHPRRRRHGAVVVGRPQVTYAHPTPTIEDIGEIAFGEIDVGIARTEGTPAQASWLGRKRELLLARIRSIRRQLKKRNLKPARRKQLLSDLASAYGDLHSTEGDIKDLATPPDAGETPTGVEAIPGAEAGLAYADRLGAEAALTPDTADDLTAAQAAMYAWQAIYNYEKTHGFSDADIADAARNLKSAQDAVGDLTGGAAAGGQADTSGLAAAIKDLKDSIDRQNQFAASVAGITSTEAIRALADVINGQIGGLVDGRARTAGIGTVARA